MTLQAKYGQCIAFLGPGYSMGTFAGIDAVLAFTTATGINYHQCLHVFSFLIVYSQKKLQVEIFF
jgi:hypothetical protein